MIQKHSRLGLLLLSVVVMGTLPARGEKVAYDVPTVVLEAGRRHPVFACSPQELERLKKAFAGDGPEGKYLAKLQQSVDKRMQEPVVYPPRGSAHNQWYQCDDCQIGLTNIDDTHHKCPKCGKIYSGPPYDDVVFGWHISQHLQLAVDAGWMYQITGDDRYARCAADILLGYAQRYESYPFHDNQNNVGDKAKISGGRLDDQTLGEASIMADRIAPAYDLIYESPVITQAEHQAIRDHLIVPMLHTIDGYKAHQSNWQSWHNAGMLCGGAVIGDADWINNAIHDETNGFLFQMDNSVSDDGFWFENSWGYHFYTLRALTILCEAARHLGADLWHHPCMHKMCTIPAWYVMPDGKLPGFNDTHAIRPVARYLEAACDVYHDPLILTLLETAPSIDSIMYARDMSLTRESVQLTSRLFSGTGHAILRAPGSAGLTAVLDFAPHGGGHGHYDALALQLYGYHQTLGIDRGIAKSQAYRLPIHRDWYKTTISHNTVLMDETQRNEGQCHLLLYAANDDYAAVIAEDADPYTSVTHRRAMLLTPDYLLVVDDLKADAPHRFNWMYHNVSKRAEALNVDQSPAEASFRGAEYMQQITAGRTDKAFAVRFVSDDVTTTMTMAADADTQVLTADGPGETVMVRIPLVMVTRQGQTARFVAAIEPIANDQSPRVSSVIDAQQATDQTIRITCNDRQELLTLAADGSLHFAIDGQVKLSGQPVGN